jgi:fumarate hydratase class II
MPVALITALAEVKRACAVVNGELGCWRPRSRGHRAAADEVLAGDHPEAFRCRCGRPAPAPRPT